MRQFYFFVLFFMCCSVATVALAESPVLQRSVSAPALQETEPVLLSDNLFLLTQAVARLNKAHGELLRFLDKTQARLVEMQTKSQDDTLRLVLSLAVLFLLFFCLFEKSERPSKKKKISPKIATTRSESMPPAISKAELAPFPLSEENDIRDEYDFMSTKQAIPAKLDLARAYVDMGDLVAAKAVLQEVIAVGNDAQISEANQLLAHLS